MWAACSADDGGDDNLATRAYWTRLLTCRESSADSRAGNAVDSSVSFRRPWMCDVVRDDDVIWSCNFVDNDNTSGDDDFSGIECSCDDLISTVQTFRGDDGGKDEFSNWSFNGGRDGRWSGEGDSDSEDLAGSFCCCNEDLGPASSGEETPNEAAQ